MRTLTSAEDILASLGFRDGQGPARWIEDAEADALILGALRMHDERLALAQPRRRRGFGVAIGVASVVLFAGGASAMLLAERFANLDVPVAPSPRVPEQPVPPKASASANAVTELPKAAEAPEAVADSTVLPTRRSGETSGTSRPEDLLRKASELRRKGDFSEAARVYEQVVSRHRGTLSAYVALVSLAGMRAAVNPGEALRLYEQARAAQPHGALDLEVLVGMARAYRHLGQVQKEVRLLKQVVEGYPDSLHGKTAQERLDSLSSSAE